MTNRCISHYSIFVFGLLFGVSSRAQNSSSICAQPGQTLPCVNQPKAGDTVVSGQLQKPAAQGNAATVSLTVAGKPVATVSISSPDLNTFEIPAPALAAGATVQITQSGLTPITVQVLPSVSDTSSVYTLGLVGLNATGASSAGPNQQYFVSFDLLTPFAWGHKCANSSNGGGQRADADCSYPLQHKWWWWFNPRIASLPSANSSAISTIGSASALSTGAGGLTIGAVTQTFEFQAGVEYFLSHGPWRGAQFGSRGTWARTGMSLIAGGGIITPFNTSAPSAEYSLNSNLAQQFNQDKSGLLAATYPQLALALCSYGFTGGGGVTCPAMAPATKPTSVALVFPNRSRFYRGYFAGLRLRTFYLTGNCPDPSSGQAQVDCKLDNVYPGTFDLRLGQDESVTQHFKGLVLTFTGTYPLPGTKGTVRAFGSAYLGLRKNKVSNPLVLVPASTVATLDQASVIVQQVNPTDQDYYRIGLGVDLVPLISKWVTSTNSGSK